MSKRNIKGKSKEATDNSFHAPKAMSLTDLKITITVYCEKNRKTFYSTDF